MANSTHLIELLVWWWILLFKLFIPNHQFSGGRHLAEASKSREFVPREGTIKTIKSETGHGEVVDCVDLYKQPAFHHPSLKNHKIQMMPSSYPRGWEAHSSAPKHVHIQPWSENEECPDGSIPILRTSAYNRHQSTTTKPSKQSNTLLNHSNAIGGIYENNGFGSYCYDLDCPGFVQIDKSYALGAVLRTSSFGGEQQTMDMKIFKDDVTGVWWLRVQDALLGYWPAELFPDLLSGANTVRWGGQIYNTLVAGRHTATRMGSGLFPGEGYRKASYMSQMLYVNSTHYVVDPEELVQIVSKPAGYSLGLHVQHGTPDKGVYFFYGGPGFSAECP
ncbi:hypothetical protein Ancab_012344 [Ancistrocladus abbreviatus]